MGLLGLAPVAASSGCIEATVSAGALADGILALDTGRFAFRVDNSTWVSSKACINASRSTSFEGRLSLAAEAVKGFPLIR